MSGELSPEPPVVAGLDGWSECGDLPTPVCGARTVSRPNLCLHFGSTGLLVIMLAVMWVVLGHYEIICHCRETLLCRSVSHARVA